MSNNNDWFLCKVTASVTHEIQNILAIIKENAGLMEDILHMNQGELLDSSGSRLKECIKNIKKQAYRGVGCTSGLNGFAHTADHAVAQISLFETIKKLIFLIQRIVNKKGIQLLITDCEHSPSVMTDPIFFQKVMYLCIECLVEVSKPKTVIRITVPPSLPGTFKKVVFECSAPDTPCICNISILPKWKEVTEVSSQISADVKITTNPNGIILSIN